MHIEKLSKLQESTQTSREIKLWRIKANSGNKKISFKISFMTILREFIHAQKSNIKKSLSKITLFKS